MLNVFEIESPDFYRVLEWWIDGVLNQFIASGFDLPRK